jgi:hypothetical protein
LRRGEWVGQIRNHCRKLHFHGDRDRKPIGNPGTHNHLHSNNQLNPAQPTLALCERWLGSNLTTWHDGVAG